MPDKMLLMTGLQMVLQYGLLLLLYLFLYKAVRYIGRDLGRIKTLPARALTANLTVVSAGHVEMTASHFNLTERVTIGRGEHNAIVIPDTFISQEHAYIERKKQGYWLVDTGSTNGTRLNEEPIQIETRLKDGDIITVGAVSFRFEG